jgi:hypothetical protein
MRVEVADARWLPLADAPRLLAHQGERATLRAAAAIVALGDAGPASEEG